MKHTRLKIGFLACVLLLAFSAYATSNATAVDLSQDQEKTLVFAMPYDFSEYSQFSADSYATAQWTSAVYGTLYKRSSANDRNFAASLAASEAQVSDDGLTVTVELKEGLEFETGDPLTAEDVVFSYKVALTPAINTNYYGFYLQNFESNSSITALDDHTVEFQLRNTYAFIYNLLTNGIIPKEVYNDNYEACVGGDADACNFNADDGSDAISAGPFKVDDIDTTEMVVTLVKNDNYFDAENVELDKIIYRKIEETSSAVSALADGTIDIMDSQYVPSVNEFDGLDNVDQSIVGAPAHQEISLNHRNEYYGTGEMVPDVTGKITNNSEQARVLRQAMSRIIDREFLVEGIMEGLAQAASTAMPSASQGWDSTLAADPYDIDEARSLMESIGFNYTDTDIDRADDESTCSAGNCFFSMTVLSPNTNPARNDWAELFVNELPKIGIEVEEHVSTGWDNIVPRTFGYAPDSENGDPLPPSYEDGGFDIMFVGYSWGLDWDPTGLYDSSGLCPDCTNFINFENKTIENQIGNYTTELDIDVRIDMVQELQEMLAYELPVIPLVYPQSNWGISKGVSGYDALLLSVSAQEWELVDKEVEPDTEEDIPFDASAVVVSLIATASIAALVSRRQRKPE